MRASSEEAYFLAYLRVLPLEDQQYLKELLIVLHEWRMSTQQPACEVILLSDPYRKFRSGT